MNTMWCDKCQQDVPGVAAEDGGKLRCLRCGRQLPSGTATEVTPAPTSCDCPEPASAKTGKTAETDDQRPAYDGWELDQQLRHIASVLGAEKGRRRKRKKAYQQEAARLDPPHTGPTAWHLPKPAKPARHAGKARTSSGQSHPVMTLLTWTALSLGTMAFVCGGILLGWSIYSGRAELWTIGLPVALCGQIALLVGLVLQLDQLRQDNRSAAAKLDDVDERLHELKTTTTILGTSQASSGGTFYAHLADGAGPELLLSDLKGQLDLLALKLNRNAG